MLQVVGQRFAHQPLSMMLSRYGAPARQMNVEGVTVYTWEAADTLYFRSQPPLYVRCQLDAYVRDGTVVDVGMAGQQGACERFLP